MPIATTDRQPKFYRSFQYNRSLLPNAHLAALETGVSDLETARGKSGQTIGYPGWGVLYFTLLSHLRPDGFNVIVETGTNQGCSTIVLAQALIDSGREGKVFTIELDAENRRKALENFERAGVADRIESVLGHSLEELPKIVRRVEPIRVAFLDGSHAYRDVVKEFETIQGKLEPQAIVLFDNTYPLTKPPQDPRVNGALRHIQRVYGGNLINLEFVSWHTPGLALWQREPLAPVE